MTLRESIKKILWENQNKWMTVSELYELININKVYEWGENQNGELGYKNMISRELGRQTNGILVESRGINKLKEYRLMNLDFDKDDKLQWNKVIQIPKIYNFNISEELLQRYHISLKTRGFVILSGVSGSGKTTLTEYYAKAVGAKYCIVSVEPSWNSNEDILGFYNPVTQKYHHTKLSEFIIEAANEYDEAYKETRIPIPYHVVLDEMNLARIENYFSSFLSAMELRERNKVVGLKVTSEINLKLSPNLFVIGTVNIDETTKSFSDKVYDRAQLIELMVNRKEIEKYLEGESYKDYILELWDKTKEVCPFAFRVLKEIKMYIEEGEKIGIPVEKLLDDVILQKILPKIKGTTAEVIICLDTLISLFKKNNSCKCIEKSEKMRRGYEECGVITFFR